MTHAGAEISRSSAGSKHRVEMDGLNGLQYIPCQCAQLLMTVSVRAIWTFNDSNLFSQPSVPFRLSFPLLPLTRSKPQFLDMNRHFYQNINFYIITSTGCIPSKCCILQVLEWNLCTGWISLPDYFHPSLSLSVPWRCILNIRTGIAPVELASFQ